MNRQIKFRGKRIDNGEWVYGYITLLKYRNETQWWIVEHIRRGGIYGLQIDPDTVGQFTGLCDKNGNEIYEGDIIQGEYKYRHLIRYSNDEACFTATLVEYVGDTVAEKWNTGRVYQDWINEFEKVVIGNIFENKELMEGGEK